MRERGHIAMAAMMSFVGLLLTGSHCQAATSQYLFGRADFVEGGSPPSACTVLSSCILMVTGDFNGDGRPDLAVLNGNNTVSIMLGQAGGGFASPVLYRTGNGAVNITLGDFNGDRKLDLAVANKTDNTVSILLGNGDGTFRLHVDYNVGALSPTWVRPGDFNGDHKLDLVTTNLSSNTVSILMGNGDGTFQAPVQYTTGSNPSMVAVADFNGDSKPDLAVSDGNGTEVFLGKGDGTFQAALIGSSATGPMTVADFNRDGHLDVAIITGEFYVDLLFGKGDGTFEPPFQYHIGTGLNGIANGDFNGDGKLDLVLSSASGGHYGVVVMLGNGNGTFQTPFPYYATKYHPVSLLWGDFNGDGKPDVAVSSGAVISILLNNGGARFATPAANTATATGSRFILKGDFNIDGKLDLAILGPNCGTGAVACVSMLLGNGDGTFQPHIDTSLDNVAFQSAVWGDVNGDGKPDLVLTNPNSNGIEVFLGNGDGTFQSGFVYATGSGPQYIALGDFNGDGHLDLAVTFSAGVSVLINNGDGTFKFHVDYATAPGPVGLTRGDFNRDGKLDLAVAAGSQISMLFGNGDGTFKPHQDFASSPINAGLLSAYDFNRDGKLDLDVNGRAILFGNGDGTFRLSQVFANAPGAVSLQLGDFNGDGVLDILENGPTILFGNGDGTFRVSPLLLGFTLGGNIVAADFNGDGAADMAGASTVPKQLSVVFNPPVPFLFPSKLNFGNEPVAMTSAQQLVTLSNQGGAPLSISSIGVTGADPGDFGQTNNCGTRMAVLSHCTIGVAFTPAATGTRTAGVTIVDNFPASPQVVTLIGMGTAPAVALSRSNLNFGPQRLGSLSAAQPVIITNTGNAPLRIDSIAVKGNFIQTNDCPPSLEPGASCTMRVAFKPVRAGAQSGTVAIESNALNAAPRLNLAGIGTAP